MHALIAAVAGAVLGAAVALPAVGQDLTPHERKLHEAAKTEGEAPRDDNLKLVCTP